MVLPPVWTQAYNPLTQAFDHGQRGSRTPEDANASMGYLGKVPLGGLDVRAAKACRLQSKARCSGPKEIPITGNFDGSEFLPREVDAAKEIIRFGPAV